MPELDDSRREPGPPEDSSAAAPSGRNGRPRGLRLWYLLLVAPFVGLLWVPLYASAAPKLLGFPFFYWYQLGAHRGDDETSPADYEELGERRAGQPALAG